MGKVWINPAFKDKVQSTKEVLPIKEAPQEVKPEKKEPVKQAMPIEKSVKKEPVKQSKPVDKPVKKQEKQKKRPAQIQQKDDLEYKFFNYLMEKEIALDVKLIDGTVLTGKIKWFSDWTMALEVDGKLKMVIRLMILYYSPTDELSLTENEVSELPDYVISSEVKCFTELCKNKSPFVFHLKGGAEIKGVLLWYEKFIYHLKSLDGKTDYSLHRNNVLYYYEDAD